LGEIRDKLAVEYLISRLETDSDPKVRAYAAQALGKIRDTNCLHSLLKALNDNAGAVRASAAAALGQIGLSKVAHALFPLLNDSDKNVRRAAAYSQLRLTKG
jgi:HEAT repeat protein